MEANDEDISAAEWYSQQNYDYFKATIFSTNDDKNVRTILKYISGAGIPKMRSIIMTAFNDGIANNEIIIEQYSHLFSEHLEVHEFERFWRPDEWLDNHNPERYTLLRDVWNGDEEWYEQRTFRASNTIDGLRACIKQSVEQGIYLNKILVKEHEFDGKASLLMDAKEWLVYYRNR